jgi:hypothetical protein
MGAMPCVVQVHNAPPETHVTGTLITPMAAV